MSRLRQAVNDTSPGLVCDDPLQVLDDVPAIELSGPAGERLEAVLAALPRR
ncbi:hypothetical protein [Sinosporangium siamense]|uniref:Uncharacterized protein n=1 Tax=Sinosporangium siamense TaxID=1367973 RepID=A0A919RHZ7_9ACTN|nr:hypothetical protein [Sinosporangium siamense]GII93983.1 hypothetical protein Ssi02_42140 [Sinosporangium siamense]